MKHTHIHVHDNVADYGTPEGARKAAMTRGRGGGGTPTSSQPRPSGNTGGPGGAANYNMTPIQQSLHAHWTSPGKNGPGATHKGPLGGSNRFPDVQVYQHPQHGQVHIHPNGTVKTGVKSQQGWFHPDKTPPAQTFGRGKGARSHLWR